MYIVLSCLKKQRYNQFSTRDVACRVKHKGEYPAAWEGGFIPSCLKTLNTFSGKKVQSEPSSHSIKYIEARSYVAAILKEELAFRI